MWSEGPMMNLVGQQPSSMNLVAMRQRIERVGGNDVSVGASCLVGRPTLEAVN